LVNWKTDLRLADFDPDTSFEITCKVCSLTRHEEQAQLIAKPGMAQAFLDEVEAALRCSSRFCRKPVRLSLIHDDKTEGFVGGMA
jgi:hypothetical protein